MQLQEKTVKTFIESKSVDERLKFYIEKLFKFINLREEELKSQVNKLDLKESLIAKLEKEIYLRGNLKENASSGKIELKIIYRK